MKPTNCQSKTIHKKAIFMAIVMFLLLPNGRTAPFDESVLTNYRQAAIAMRSGQYDKARLLLDQVIPLIGGIVANNSEARQARSLFSSESVKTFLGEPYERVMAYYYRGVLYWMDGEFDNARACFKTGQIIDSDTEYKTYSADYVTLEYLSGLASQFLGNDGGDSFNRAQTIARNIKLPEYPTNCNTVFFIECGNGPIKYATGKYNEQLEYEQGMPGTDSAILVIDGKASPVSLYDDLDFQAATRGGRKMDNILANKASTKGKWEDVGAELEKGNVVTLNPHHDAESLGDAIFQALTPVVTIQETKGHLFSGIVKKVAEDMEPAADIRCWDNLPRYISVAARNLSIGEHHCTISFKNNADVNFPIDQKDFTINVSNFVDRQAFFLSGTPLTTISKKTSTKGFFIKSGDDLTLLPKMAFVIEDEMDDQYSTLKRYSFKVAASVPLAYGTNIVFVHQGKTFDLSASYLTKDSDSSFLLFKLRDYSRRNSFSATARFNKPDQKTEFDWQNFFGLGRKKNQGETVRIDEETQLYKVNTKLSSGYYALFDGQDFCVFEYSTDKTKSTPQNQIISSSYVFNQNTNTNKNNPNPSVANKLQKINETKIEASPTRESAAPIVIPSQLSIHETILPKLPSRDGVYLANGNNWSIVPLTSCTVVKITMQEVQEDHRLNPKGPWRGHTFVLNCGDSIPVSGKTGTTLCVRGELMDINADLLTGHSKIQIVKLPGTGPEWILPTFVDAAKMKVTFGNQSIVSQISEPKRNYYIIQFSEELKPGYYGVFATSMFIFEIR